MQCRYLTIYNNKETVLKSPWLFAPPSSFSFFFFPSQQNHPCTSLSPLSLSLPAVVGIEQIFALLGGVRNTGGVATHNVEVGAGVHTRLGVPLHLRRPGIQHGAVIQGENTSRWRRSRREEEEEKGRRKEKGRGKESAMGKKVGCCLLSSLPFLQYLPSKWNGEDNLQMFPASPFCLPFFSLSFPVSLSLLPLVLIVHLIFSNSQATVTLGRWQRGCSRA